MCDETQIAVVEDYSDSGWVCDCDSFLFISIVENNLVYLRSILDGLTIMIVSRAIENNLVNLRG